MKVKVRRLPKEIKLNVTVVTTREFRARKWIAVKLIVLAARVLGCSINIEDGK